MDYEERVETSTKWCKAHQKKSLLHLFQCPLYFLLWPELPVLTPEVSSEPPEEVFEQCELCGNCYKRGSLPVEGLQVGVTKIGGDFDNATRKQRSRHHVTFASCIAVDSNFCFNNGSNEEEQEKTEEQEQTEERQITEEKANGIAKNLSDVNNTVLSSEGEGELSENEESECNLLSKKKNN